jgi:hypothetical protein
MSLPVNPPRLEEILATHSPIFIGTVVDSGGLGRMAKIKVEIPIRGEAGKIFEVRNRGGGSCFNGFEVGERWFFSGTRSGSHYFDGSTILIDRLDDVRPSNEEFFKEFPEALKPPPSSVVQNYLKEK